MAQSGAFEEIIARRDEDGSCLVKNKFIEMKELLEKIFKDFGKEQDYKEWQAKGLKEWQEYQKTIAYSARTSNPQIY